MIRFGLACATSGLLVLSLGSGPAGERADQPQQPRTEVGNQACRPCHEAIYESYSRTAMARTSGAALPALIEGSFEHAPSGVSYRVLRRGQTGVLAYSRAGPPELQGSQPLKYYLGSNTRGRTFLFEIDGFLYQAPINYYTAKNGWEMSPGYPQLREMELNHPVDSTCLFCHASRVRRPRRVPSTGSLRAVSAGRCWLRAMSRTGQRPREGLAPWSIRQVDR